MLILTGFIAAVQHLNAERVRHGTKRQQSRPDPRCGDRGQPPLSATAFSLFAQVFDIRKLFGEKSFPSRTDLRLFSVCGFPSI